jgi:hypothetical protein
MVYYTDKHIRLQVGLIFEKMGCERPARWNRAGRSQPIFSKKVGVPLWNHALAIIHQFMLKLPPNQVHAHSGHFCLRTDPKKWKAAIGRADAHGTCRIRPPNRPPFILGAV